MSARLPKGPSYLAQHAQKFLAVQVTQRGSKKRLAPSIASGAVDTVLLSARTADIAAATRL